MINIQPALLINEVPDDPCLTDTQNRIYKIIRDKGAMDRRHLNAILKLPRTTIYDNLIKLQKKKLIEKHPLPRDDRGRPIIVWDLVKK